VGDNKKEGINSVMTELQLTQVALVGARMPTFKPYGFDDRNQIALRVVIPDEIASLEQLTAARQLSALRAQLPVWVHNIISDLHFPQREQLLMPLRRFEGELYDNRQDEVVASVLSAGFKSQPLDPLKLPAVMPLRQRCALVMQIGVWQDAYRVLEQDLTKMLAQNLAEISRWASLYQDDEARCLAAEY
jgi:hypothetical protein